CAAGGTELLPVPQLAHRRCPLGLDRRGGVAQVTAQRLVAEVRARRIGEVPLPAQQRARRGVLGADGRDAQVHGVHRAVSSRSFLAVRRPAVFIAPPLPGWTPTARTGPPAWRRGSGRGGSSGGRSPCAAAC